MKRYLIALVFFLSAVIAPFAANTDKWNLSGEGTYNAKDMVHVDSLWNLRLFNGSIVLGDNNLAPSTTNPQTTASITSGGFYGIKLPITNGSGAASVAGQVVCASTTVSGVQGTFNSLTATTTVLGVVDAAYSNGSTMYYTTMGYANVLTTGAVKVGDILVSSSSALGRAGSATGTVVVGTVIGKALTAGAAAGDTVLALIQLQ